MDECYGCPHHHDCDYTPEACQEFWGVDKKLESLCIAWLVCCLILIIMLAVGMYRVVMALIQ